MKFHWTDGTTKEVKISASLRPVKHMNRRPRTVEFKAYEVLMLASHPEYAQMIAAGMEVVPTALEG